MTRSKIRAIGVTVATVAAIGGGATAAAPSASASSGSGWSSTSGSHCSGKAAQRLGGHSFWGGCSSW